MQQGLARNAIDNPRPADEIVGRTGPAGHHHDQPEQQDEATERKHHAPKTPQDGPGCKPAAPAYWAATVTPAPIIMVPAVRCMSFMRDGWLKNCRLLAAAQA